MQIQDAESAWAAGFMDGDGCISLARRNRFKRPEIVADSTDRELLEEMKRLFGGTIVIKKKYKEHHRQAWHWRLHGSDRVRAMLTAVLPHMRCQVKKQRGQLLLDEWREVTPRNGHYTEEAASRKLDFEARFAAIGAGRGSQRTPSATVL